MGILSMDVLDFVYPAPKLCDGVYKRFHLMTRLPLQAQFFIIQGGEEQLPGIIIDGNVPLAPFPHVPDPAVLHKQALAVMLVCTFEQVGEEILPSWKRLFDAGIGDSACKACDEGRTKL
ncbi:hypothetical protein SDC9_84407 [bioreactor metagenome]|uniref:Uncharacterized protein n=1 Tax=bioreactor metagenome TaxID=1076179 RepID=A0A644ZBY7_9ZZZZ